MKKINLKEDGVILFFGTTNAMPMMYALELKKKNQDVMYFVDEPIANTLSRPENHFLDISYPYPEWIIEFVLPSELLPAICPRFLFKYMWHSVDKWKEKKIKAVFMGGAFISFAKYIQRDVAKYYLSYGADLELWCDPHCSKNIMHDLIQLSFFKYLPKFLSIYILKKILNHNYHGALASDAVCFFPRGFSQRGDEMIKKLINGGVSYLTRYDICFDLLSKVSREQSLVGDKLIILSPVRFFYKNIPNMSKDEYKGNDLIIKGLSMYYAVNPNIEIHFFEKGPDVDDAKLLCQSLGITEVVVWHQQLRLQELFALYEQAHICFDQVGRHWVGAVGMYALYMGKAVIANTSNLSFLGEIPILNVKTADDIFKALLSLESSMLMKKLHEDGKKFAEEKLNPNQLLDNLISA